MTPGRLRMRSCMPQKHPPARMAVSVSLPTVVLLRLLCLIQHALATRRSHGESTFVQGDELGAVASSYWYAIPNDDPDGGQDGDGHRGAARGGGSARRVEAPAGTSDDQRL